MEIKTESTSEVQDQFVQLAKAAINTLSRNSSGNPWSSDEVDKLEFNTDKYDKLIQACRFFYTKDPLVSSTLNKMVEIGINDLIFSKNGLSENEFRIFTAIEQDLKQFAEVMALEYLISGLIVPEIQYGRLNKQQIKSKGIKNYSTLIMPITMSIRDPELIKIKKSPFGDQPSYFLKIPQEIVYFILNKGKYSDGTEDKAAYEKLVTYYPDFVRDVERGKREIQIEDTELIIRRKPQPNNPYPIPYLSAALESLKHKRNLRRMDYAIASRVIGAIQLFKLGSDDFPVTEDNAEDQFGAIKEQMIWRDTAKDVERIFQLFANHTLQVEWIVPDTEALLNEQKYISVNQDIIYSLGFPRILITGETERTGTSDPQYAMMSPSRTMENFRSQIIKVLQDIVNKIAEQNGLKKTPEIKFKPLTLFDHATLLKSLADLYNAGNISRHTYAKELGYDWDDETEERKTEKETLTKMGLDEFAPRPFSNQPGEEGKPGDSKTTTSKPSDVKKTSNNQDGAN